MGVANAGLFGTWTIKCLLLQVEDEAVGVTEKKYDEWRETDGVQQMIAAVEPLAEQHDCDHLHGKPNHHVLTCMPSGNVALLKCTANIYHCETLG